MGVAARLCAPSGQRLAAWLAGKPAGIDNLDAARRDDERWQAALWRRVAGDLGTDRRHPSVAFFDAMKAMGPDAPARAGLPAAAHVFCLPTTPPGLSQGASTWRRCSHAAMS